MFEITKYRAKHNRKLFVNTLDSHNIMYWTFGIATNVNIKFSAYRRS